AGDGAKPLLPVGVGEAAREHGADIAAQPAILTLRADHPVRDELPVGADLHTAEETAVAVAAGGEAREIVVAGEGAADMAADIEAGPIIDRHRYRIGRRRAVIGTAPEICGMYGKRSADCDERNCSQKKCLHWFYSNT